MTVLARRLRLSALAMGLFVTAPAALASGIYDEPPVIVHAPPQPWYDSCGINCPWNNDPRDAAMWRPTQGDPAHNSYDWQDASTCDKETSGNPVVLSTGNKVERELDFASEGEMGLYLERTYNHHWGHVGLFGGHWLSNFDYTLVFQSVYTTAAEYAWSQRPDGRRIKYVRDEARKLWVEAENRVSTIQYDTTLKNYVLRNEDGSTEYYLSITLENGRENSFGAPISKLRNKHGIGWDFSYTPNSRYLTQVTHTSGQRVQFWWTNGNLTQVTDPAGNIYEYTYTPNVFGGGSRLTSTKHPGPPDTTTSYHYEDSRFPGALTGKSFNGMRYSTFTYDERRRATSTQHADGVERYLFGYQSYEVAMSRLPQVWSPGNHRYNYDPEPDGSDTIVWVPASTATTEVNPLGRRTTYSYKDGKKTGVSGDLSPNCPAAASSVTRDAYGNEDIVRDFADNATDYDFDAHGHLLEKVEAAARTTTYEWDEANNRPVRVTIAGERETRYTYDGAGRVLSETVKNLNPAGSVGQERTTTYAYALHSNGMLALVTRDGPLAGAMDAMTRTYSPAGALLSAGNAAGQTTRYENHNAFGRPGRVIDPAGAITDYGYDARGRIVLERRYPNGPAVDTHYVYGASGLLEGIQRSDGMLIVYTYDAARRVTREDVTRPGGGYDVRFYTYNAMSQPARIDTAHD